MKHDIKFFTKEHLYITVSSVTIFFLTFPLIGSPILIGLDPSHVFARNYFFANNIQIGRDIIFTYGPLGFLLDYNMPVKNNLFFSIVFISAFKFFFILSFLYLDSLVKKYTAFADRLFSLFIMFVASSMIDFGYVLVFLTAVLLLLSRETANKTYLFSAIVVSAMGLMVKSSVGIISISIVISFSLVEYFQSRSIRRLILTNFGILLSFVSLWIFIYHNLSGIGSFLYGTIELSIGNSSAMTLNPANNWILLSTFIVLFSYLPFYIKDNRIYFLYGIFLLASFASWKYAFSRADHSHYFFFFIFFFYSLLLVYLREIKLNHLLIILISLLSISVNAKLVGANPPNIIDYVETGVFNGIKIFNETVINFKEYERRLIAQSEDILKTNTLKKDALQIIAKSNVDTYPWEATYIPANSLSWRPRPVFQSYAAYTPWLDNRNAEFFKSDKAPRFILWELDHDGGEVGSIDKRYLLNDEPLTIYQIFNRYKPVYRDQKMTILERVSESILKEPEIIGQTKGRWEEWIKVPSTDNGILRAKINFSRKFLGKLKRIIYKEEEFFIFYKLENGEIKKYRLVIDNAGSGVWINPLIVKLTTPLYGLKVKEIMLSHSKYDFIKRDIRIDWQLIKSRNDMIFAETHIFEPGSSLQNIKLPGETNNLSFFIDKIEHNEQAIKISGWAFIKGKSAENNKTCIVLKSNRNNYVFDTYPHRRPDVTAYYKPLNLNLDDSGFSAVIDRRLIKSGEYKVGIYIKKNRVEALQLIGETIAITNNKVLLKESF